jgi:FtsZ-binding cell division protein ZapB
LTQSPQPQPHTQNKTHQLKEAEAARLREEAEAAVDARRFLQEEVEGLKRALASTTTTGVGVGAGSAAAAGGGGGLSLTVVGGEGRGLFEESGANVRERLARLERENKALKRQLEGAWGLSIRWFVVFFLKWSLLGLLLAY